MNHKIVSNAMLGFGLAVAAVFLTANRVEGKSFITVQPNAAPPADTAYIITVSWEGGLPNTTSSAGNVDNKTLLIDSTTTVPSGALAGATIRYGLNNNNAVDQDNTTTNSTTTFYWDGTNGSTAAVGSPNAESHSMNIGYGGSNGSDVYNSAFNTNVLVYCSGVDGVTSLASHLGIENSALYFSSLGSPFGFRLRNQTSPTADFVGLIMKKDRSFFPANGLAIVSLPYATGSTFGSMFNAAGGTFSVTDGTTGLHELVVTTDPTYVPKVFKPAIAIEQPESTSIANNGSQDFGSVSVGSNSSLTFTVRNSGTSALNLSGTAPDYVTVSGTNPGDFTVTAQPSSSVAAAGTTTFTVQFSPTAAGARSAVLTVASNDRVNGTYTINLNGTGAAGGNTDPTISDIANQTIPSGGNTGALAFTVGDAETAVGSLSLSVSANSNSTLVPNGNIVFGGSDASRTVTVTPVSGLSGTATITIRVTDGGSLFAEDTFTVTATDNYLSWATASGVTGGPEGDSDNDGVKNLIEYALVDGGERGTLSGNTITFTKRGGVYGSDLAYDIESSTSLSGWSVLDKPPVIESASEIKYTFTPGTPSQDFFRLKVVVTP